MHAMIQAFKDTLKPFVRRLDNWHRHDPDHPPVFVFSTPRSGSTWLAELFLSQPGFKFCNEPFDLRDPYVRGALGMREWHELYDPANRPRIQAYLQDFL